jgi:hypothetical protein
MLRDITATTDITNAAARDLQAVRAAVPSRQ